MGAHAAVIDLADYRDRLAGLDPGLFVGSIIWFSIAGTVDRSNGGRTTVPVRVTHDQLNLWFDELGLDKNFLPAAIKKVDAFRKASSTVAREYKIDADKTAILMVREVTSDTEQVVRQIVREVRDGRAQKLDYVPHMATVKFFRAKRSSKGRSGSGDTIKWVILNQVVGVDRENVQSMLNEIQSKYDDAATNLQAQAIRGMIRDYVTSLNAISVKTSGGVYFVHNSRQREIDALQELVRRIGQGCSFHQLPLIDAPDQRAMLSESFQDEVEEDVQRLLTDIADLNAATHGKIPAQKYAVINARLQEVSARAEEHTRVLGLSQERAASALELALEAVVGLAEHIDSRPKRG